MVSPAVTRAGSHVLPISLPNLPHGMMRDDESRFFSTRDEAVPCLIDIHVLFEQDLATDVPVATIVSDLTSKDTPFRIDEKVS